MTSMVDTVSGTETEEDLLPDPDQFQFTNEDVDRAMARPRLRASTYYRLQVTGAKTGVWPVTRDSSGKLIKGGSVYADLTVNPLDAEGKTRGPATRLRIDFPFANPKVAGHTAPDNAWLWQKLMTALYPDKYPADPRRQDNGTWMTADGQIVSKDEALALKKAAVAAAGKAANAYYRNINDFVKEVFVASIKANDYREVDGKTICSEPPPGVELRLTDFADHS